MCASLPSALTGVVFVHTIMFYFVDVYSRIPELGVPDFEWQLFWPDKPVKKIQRSKITETDVGAALLSYIREVDGSNPGSYR
jgi:hypothetical protein